MTNRLVSHREPPDLPGGPNPTLAESDESSIGPLLSNAVRILRRRRILAASVFLIFLVPVVLFIRQRPLKYSATARILVEPNDEVKSVLHDRADGQPSDDFQTQLQVLRSRPLVAKTIVKSKLWQEPAFTGKVTINNGTEAEVSAVGFVDLFLSQLSISSTPNTHILNVSYESTDPAIAMTAVNALVQTHIDERTKAEFAASGETLDWLNARLAEAREKLRASETALQSYVENKDAVSLQDRQNIVVQKLADLSASVTKAKTDRITKETLYDQLKAFQDGREAIESFPVVMSNSTLQQLRAQVAELKQKELTMSQELGDKHPDLIKLRAEIAATEGRLRTELSKVIDSVKNEYLAAEAQEQNLTRALDAQKRDVLDLNRKGVEFGALQRQAASDREIYERLLRETQTRGVTGKTAESKIEVVESAELPRTPLGPPRSQEYALALMASLMLAIAAPIVRESLDSKVKTPADLEKRLQVRCLAMVPTMSNDTQGKGPLLTNEANAFNEAFRKLRTAICLAPTDAASGSTRVLVTSAAPKEGKSTVAANLAIALSQMNQRVLLIDADLRRPKAHKILGVTPFPGFADVLNGDAAIGDAIRQTNYPNLFVLPCGMKHVSASELLSSSRLEHVLNHLDDGFGWIVFDSPPTGPVADACIIGQWVQHAIMVASADLTPITAARGVTEQLANAHVPVMGFVLNRVDLEHSAYYYAPYHSANYGDYYVKPKGDAARPAVEAT
jgi:capsular exopolysaccharide synthesis family protein